MRQPKTSLSSKTTGGAKADVNGEWGSFTSLPNGFELISNENSDTVSKIISIPFTSKVKDVTFCE